jgi:hypothetical protein
MIELRSSRHFDRSEAVSSPEARPLASEALKKNRNEGKWARNRANVLIFSDLNLDKKERGICCAGAGNFVV